MLVVIGTLRAPKVNAVKTAFARFGQYLEDGGEEITFLPCSAESGISAMPMSLHELMQGACNRARDAARQQPAGQHVDFAIGLEGGFFMNKHLGDERFFLQSWAYVEHVPSGRGFFGSSAAIPVPEKISTEIVTSGAELGDIIDHYGRELNIRDKGGAFEVFSRGLINRQGSFELAVVCAMAPFYQDDLYR